MLRLFQIEGDIGKYSDWRDHLWVVMSDSHENAAAQFKKRTDAFFSKFYDLPANRYKIFIKVSELIPDDFGVFNTEGNNWKVFEV